MTRHRWHLKAHAEFQLRPSDAAYRAWLAALPEAVRAEIPEGAAIVVSRRWPSTADARIIAPVTHTVRGPEA